MGILHFFKSTDINQGVARFRDTQGAVLVDVRTGQEYRSGHIPGSISIPIDRIGDIQDQFCTDTPLFVHCQSGMRSSRAVSALKQLGYTNVIDIGGLNAYKGKLEV